jgi:hypothetical protein
MDGQFLGSAEFFLSSDRLSQKIKATMMAHNKGDGKISIKYVH